MHKHALAALIAFTLVGCDESASPAGGASAGGSGGAGQGANSPQGGGSEGGGMPGESYSVTFDAVTVPAGEEDTQCVVKKLTNTEAKHVGRIHNQLGPGSHHLIVYRTNDTEEQPDPFPCQPFADLLNPAKGTPLMITQKSDDELVLPPGVAFAIGQAQFVRLEMHYLNATIRFSEESGLLIQSSTKSGWHRARAPRRARSLRRGCRSARRARCLLRAQRSQQPR